MGPVPDQATPFGLLWLVIRITPREQAVIVATSGLALLLYYRVTVVREADHGSSACVRADNLFTGKVCSVHLEPTHSLDIVEGVGLVTEITLLDTGAALSGDPLIHHLEMHHVVAGRRLMALIAVLRPG